jgi:WD40 repeat protein
MMVVTELLVIATMLAFFYWCAMRLVSSTTDTTSPTSSALVKACSDRPVYRIWIDSNHDRLWAFRPSNVLTGYDMQTGSAVVDGNSYGVRLARLVHCGDGRVSLYVTEQNAVHLVLTNDPEQRHAVLEETAPNISDIALSNDGSLAMAAYADGLITGWSISETQLTPFEYRFPGLTLTQMSLSRDGDTLCVVFKDGTLSFHKPLTGERLIEAVKLDADATEVVWSRDGQSVAVATQKGTISLIDATSGQHVWKTQLDRPYEVGMLMSLALSDDGRWIAASGLNKRLLLWDRSRSSSTPHSLAGHDGIVRALAFSPSNSMIYTGGYDGQICEWSLDSLTIARKFE